MTAQDRPFVSFAGVASLCNLDRKCMRKRGHDGKCWPTTEEQEFYGDEEVGWDGGPQTLGHDTYEEGNA